MSAEEITSNLLKELDKDYLDVVILNYANGDNFFSTIKEKSNVSKFFSFGNS